jgi:hypothetical protein
LSIFGGKFVDFLENQCVIQFDKLAEFRVKTGNIIATVSGGFFLITTLFKIQSMRARG